MIDWVTVSAQAINFLVLVFLLKRFLYAPVINAMTRREERIAERLNSARLREQDAEEKVHRFEEKNQEFDQQRENMLLQAQRDADATRQRIEDDARREVEQKRLQWQADVEREKEDFLKLLRKQAAESIMKMARKVLRDLADADLETQAIGTFIHRLENMTEEDRRVFIGLKPPAVVTTSFVLDERQRSHISAAIGNLLGHKVEVEFTRSENLIWGIEFRIEGRKLGWTSAAYLDELERRVAGKLSAVGKQS